ncbi:MAG: hypothetical protein Fur0016_29350 [Anaerolineales bacterium]
MTKYKLVLLGIALLLVSLACVVTIPVPGRANPPAVTSPSDTPTLTQPPTSTLAPSKTPVPPPTQRAVVTEAVFAFPTITPPPLIPTMTLADFSEKVTGLAPTASRTPGRLVVNWSPTPASWECKAELQEPAFGQDFKPRDDFMAFWRIYNVGTAPWAQGEFVFEYVDGDKLHKVDDYQPELLSYVVYVSDKYPFSVRMFAPKEPGRYTTTWGLRKINKKEYFCTFSVTIDVVKK